MNRFSRKTFYLVLFLSVASSVYSQKEFYNGYIINAAGDTLQGKIHYRETDYSPRKISFRNETDTLSYTTSQLKEFMLVRVDNDTVIFRKAIVTYAAAKAQLIELTVSDSGLLLVF